MAGMSDEEVMGMSDDEVMGRDDGPMTDAQVRGMSDDEVMGNNKPEAQGKLMTAAHEFAHNVIPGIVGLGTAALGGMAGTAAAGPVGAVVGGAGGFMAGSSAAEAVQEGLLHAIAPEWAAQEDAQRQANREANHYSALAGELGGSMIGMGPGSVAKAGSAIVDKFGRPIAEAITRGAAGAAQAGFGAVSNAIQGEDQDAGDLALQFAAGALFPGLNKYGEKAHQLGENIGENIAARYNKVAGRPNATRNADADAAHEAVGDTTTQTQAEDTNTEGNAFAETPPDATDQNAGQIGAREDNKPTNSKGENATGKGDDSYDKRKEQQQQANNAGVTTGDMDEATKAALDQTNGGQETATPSQPSYKTEATVNGNTQTRAASTPPGAEDIQNLAKPPSGAEAQPQVNAPNSAPPKTASVPFMITNAMKADLAKRGMTPEQIKNLTPQQAHQILSTPVTATVSQPPKAKTAVRQSKKAAYTPKETADPTRLSLDDNSTPPKGEPRIATEEELIAEARALNEKLRAQRGLGPNDKVDLQPIAPAMKEAGLVEGGGKSPPPKAAAAKAKSKNAQKKSAPAAKDAPNSTGDNVVPFKKAKEPPPPPPQPKATGRDRALNLLKDAELYGSKLEPDEVAFIKQHGLEVPAANNRDGGVVPLAKDTPEARAEGIKQIKETNRRAREFGYDVKDPEHLVPGDDELARHDAEARGEEPKKEEGDDEVAREIAKLRAENEKIRAEQEKREKPATPKKATRDKAVFKKLLESVSPEERERLKTASDEEIEAAIAGKRNRNYGNKGNYPVHPELPGSTANTPKLAAERAGVHEKVKAWFKKSHRTQEQLDEETQGQTLARISHHNYPSKGKWTPADKTREWLLAREARNVLSSPGAYNKDTKRTRLQQFREDERILRHGSDEAVEEFKKAKQLQDKLRFAKGRGSEGVEKAENKAAAADTQGHTETALEKMEREEKEWLGQNYKEGTFERVDPEAIAEGIVERAINNRKDNAERPKKTKDLTATVSEAAKPEEETAMTAAMKKAEAEAQKKAEIAAARERANQNVSPEDRAKYEAAANASDRQVKQSLKGDELKRMAKDFEGNEDASLNHQKIFADVKKALKWFFGIGGKLGSKVSHRDTHAAHSETDAVGKWLQGLPKLFHENEQHNKAANLTLQKAAHKMWDASSEPTDEAKIAQQKRIFEARDADSAHYDLDTKKPLQKGAVSNLDRLSAEDKKLYDDHLKEVFDENKDFKEGGDIYVKRRNKDFPIARDVEHHTAHLADGATSEYNLLVDKNDPTGQQYNGLSVSASMSNNRKYHALEDSTGARHVVQEREEGGYNIWKNGKSTTVKDPSFEFKANQPYTYTDKNGVKKTFTMREAMASEKEQHARGMDQTGGGHAAGMLKYQHNAALSAFVTNSLMGARYRNLRLLDRIMGTQEWKDHTTKNEFDKRVTSGAYVESKFPNLKGTYMDKRLAHVMDQYAKPGFDSPDWWRNLNHAITNTLFWMPTAHLANVGTHWFIGRGWDNVTPAGFKSLVKNGARAIKDVWNVSDDYIKATRDGAGLISPGVRTSNFAIGLADDVGANMRTAPKGTGWRRVADIVGLPAKELGHSIMDWSRRIMWAGNDMFLLQRIYELEDKGLSREQAITHAERDIPNYQVPDKVMGSQFISKLMKSNDLFTFGRYHFGMWNAYANMVKDTFHPKSTMADRIDGAGKLFAMGLLAYGVYPMLDKFAQFVTGNKDASENRRGPLSLPSHLAKFTKGQEDLTAAFRGTLTVTPLISTLIEAASNHDWRGKNIREPGDVADAFGQGQGNQSKARGAAKVLTQTVEHAARGVFSPLGTVENAYAKHPEDAGVKGVGKAALRGVRDQAADVHDPSDAETNWLRKSQKLNDRDARLREKHHGHGIAEDLLNRAWPRQ